jgi:hypothetical protein
LIPELENVLGEQVPTPVPLYLLVPVVNKAKRYIVLPGIIKFMPVSTLFTLKEGAVIPESVEEVIAVHPVAGNDVAGTPLNEVLL